MAMNFSDKQKWVATLEAIITHSPDTFKRKDAVSTTPEKKTQFKILKYEFLFLLFKLFLNFMKKQLFSHFFFFFFFFFMVLQKLLGNTILTTSDEKRLEINCSLSLSDKVCSSVPGVLLMILIDLSSGRMTSKTHWSTLKSTGPLF